MSTGNLSALFLYSDGVSEPTIAEGKMFGTGMMFAAMNSEKNAMAGIILHNAQSAVDDFLKEVGRFDILIML